MQGKICRGCRGFVEREKHRRQYGYCDSCYPTSKKALLRGVYDDPRWRRVSRYVIARDRACVDCGATDSLVADHVIGALDLIALGRSPFDANECVARCLPCSGRKDVRRRADRR